MQYFGSGLLLLYYFFCNAGNVFNHTISIHHTHNQLQKKYYCTLTCTEKDPAWSTAVPWWELQLCSSSGLLEVKDGGWLTERHLLWLWRPWRGEWWLKWAPNWIGCRGNLVRVPGWLAPLPTTPPQTSLYPHAEIMYDSTVMVDGIYSIWYVYDWLWRRDECVVQYEKKLNSSCHTFGWGEKIWVQSYRYTRNISYAEQLFQLHSVYYLKGSGLRSETKIKHQKYLEDVLLCWG